MVAVATARMSVSSAMRIRTDSSAASSSCTAVAVSVCAVFQFEAVKLSVGGDSVRAPGSELVAVSGIVPPGAASMTRVYWPWWALPPPGSSSRLRLDGETVKSVCARTATSGVVRAPARACAEAATSTDSEPPALRSAPP